MRQGAALAVPAKEEPELILYAQQLCDSRLAAYRDAPHDAEEHANIETAVLAGGYAYRQVAELIQNAADAVAEAGEEGEAGRIVVEADDRGLWCANTGAPVDAVGVRALLNSHASGKRAGQIGRFGLGFKSLLRLGGNIDVLSRSVCLHFDPERNRGIIRRHLGLLPDAPAPGLRLADSGHWEEEIATAPGASRFAWASTVVFAELNAHGSREAVTEEIRQFPAEFLLFLPCDVELILRANDAHRHLRRTSDPDGFVHIEDLANDGGAPQRWRVFETVVKVTAADALADATSVHYRETVPLIWATPAGSTREAAGRFYAFFPTGTETRTLGIINAPWKLNSDRTAVIPGAWNSALMQAAADLIAAKLPELAHGDDPGATLDAFPREAAQNEVAAPLIAALWKHLTTGSFIPDCDGELRPAMELRRPPIDDPELTDRWSILADEEACRRHVHASCLRTVSRLGRLRQLAERIAATAAAPDELPRLQRTPALEWLQLTATDDPDDATEVLRYADRFAAKTQGYVWDEIKEASRIILTEASQLATASEVTLHYPAELPLASVHAMLRADDELRAILINRFNVQDSEDTDWERILDAAIDRASRQEDWSEVWVLLRRMPWDAFAKLGATKWLCVKTLTGWRIAEETFLPGGLVQLSDLSSLANAEDRQELSSYLVDTDFHGADQSLLAELGIGEGPAHHWSTDLANPDASCPTGRWLARWRDSCVSDYYRSLSGSPQLDRLGPASFRLPTAWGLMLLCPPERRVEATRHLLDTLCKAPSAYLSAVEFHHRTRPKTYAPKKYLHPALSLIAAAGEVGRCGPPIKVSALLAPDFPNIAEYLPSLEPLRPAIDLLRKLAVSKTVDGTLAEPWRQSLGYASHERIELQQLAPLYDRAAQDGQVPASVCSLQGPLPLTEVRLATSAHELLLAAQAGILAVCLNPATARLWREAGARPLSADIRLEWVSASDETPSVLLIDLEPALRDVLRGDIAESARVIVPELMEQRLGVHSRSAEWTVSGGQLVISRDALNSSGWEQRVRLLIEAASAAGWIDDPDPLEKVLKSGVSARRKAVAAENDPPGRLLRAVGGADRLIRLFEPDIRVTLADDPRRVASVAITLFGPALLALPEIREGMREQGLQPPERWGTEAAADFVAAIGFAPEYAVSPTRRREAELAVCGPLPLKPLHDFQEEIVAGLDDLFSDELSPRRRAVISLPTGAGKTRVAAETAVRRILGESSLNRLVLWIAQSDELCEQAVQCFREIWTNIGVPGEALRLIRFWGGQVNPAPAARDEAAVIVASIQTLTSRSDDPALDWANHPGLIVIDECHHALSPSYTGLLRWLKPDRTSVEKEPPIVGLSATPFRGRSQDETAQLARRFDNRLYPRQQAHLFEKLQSRGVLAKFCYAVLNMEEEFTLTTAEEIHLEQFNQLNDTALKRLGESQERNSRILDAVAASEERSVLIFAASVAHAHRLAAHLNVMGISAATVTGDTDQASRRWFIRSFQRGDIRVLCNHSALTTGFDAPATDLIIIARPVFSPSLYMQMVGRGLRGPANGGKEICRILTVQDNFQAYTGKLAHHYFKEYYIEASSNSGR